MNDKIDGREFFVIYMDNAATTRLSGRALEAMMPYLTEQYANPEMCIRDRGYALNRAGIGAYIMSGDNYPRRIPAANDAERLRLFRMGGLRGMLASGEYSDEKAVVLRELWQADADAEPETARKLPWMQTYQQAGAQALSGYLGTPEEIDFDEVNDLSLIHIFYIALAVVFLAPLLFLFVSSVKSETQLVSDMATLKAFIPYGNLTLENYVAVFEKLDFLHYFRNSAVNAIIQVFVGMFIKIGRAHV